MPRANSSIYRWLLLLPGPIVLVGHSLGGLYSLMFARRNPEQVAQNLEA